MKRLLLLSVLLVAICACKRKQILREPTGKLVEGSSTCYNGVKDGDEVAIDCGGSCKQCDMATPSCTQNPNTLTFSSSNLTITNVTSGPDPNNNYYQFTGLTSIGSLSVMVIGSSPDMSHSYNTVYSSEPVTSDEAVVMIDSPNYGSLTGGGGEVFVNVSNGKLVAYVCNVTFHSFVTTLDYTGKIKIAQP